MVQPRNSSQIYQSNIKTLFMAVKENGPISKRELQQKTNLSWGAVSSLIGKLVDSGYVIPTGKQSTFAGRKPETMDINQDDNFVIGIDINLSGICGVATDLKGRIIWENTRLLARNDCESVKGTIFSLLDEIIFREFKDKKIVGIGVAMQGVVDARKGISVQFPQIQGWERVPIKRMIEDRYGIVTHLMHDPDCLMTAERSFGGSYMSLAKNIMLLRIDHGIGMSLVLNGELYLGSEGKACEIEHVPMGEDGPLCICGKRGCLAEFASGSGLVRRFVEQVNQGRKSNVNIDNLNRSGYKELAVTAKKGDALCKELFTQMGGYLGRAICWIVNILNPDVVVLCGDMVRYRELFFDVLQAQLDMHLFDDISCRLVFSKLGSDAAAQGTAIATAEKLIDGLDLPIEGDASDEEGTDTEPFQPEEVAFARSPGETQPEESDSLSAATPAAYDGRILPDMVFVDKDKSIVRGLSVGEGTCRITATFVLPSVGSLLNEGIGFYFQNGDGSPAWSFYRFTLWRVNGTPGRLDFYVEKQYEDSWKGFLYCTVGNELTTKERYVSTDYGWDTSEETEITMIAVVNPATSIATATIIGTATKHMATITVDLSKTATNGDCPADQWRGGGVFLRIQYTKWANFTIRGYDDDRVRIGNINPAWDMSGGNPSIVTRRTVGTRPFRLQATITPQEYAMNAGILFYYHNDASNPNWSYYRLSILREIGTDVGRLDFYVEKQYMDAWKGFVYCTVADEAEEKERYVSVDYGWDTTMESAFDVVMEVDPAANTLRASVTGKTSGKSAMIAADLTRPGTGEATASLWHDGGIGVLQTGADWSDVTVDGFDS